MAADPKKFDADPKKFGADPKKYRAEEGFPKRLPKGGEKGSKRRAWTQILESLKQILKSFEQILKSLRPCDAFEGSLRRLGDGSGGPWCVFWTKVCPKRVPKGCPKGVKRELKNKAPAKYENVVSTQYLLGFGHVGSPRKATFWDYFGVLT